MAKTSIPASLRLCAGGMTSSCDFPSVMRIPILGMPGRDPDSGLKLFSRTKVRARPGGQETGHSVSCWTPPCPEVTPDPHRHLILHTCPPPPPSECGGGLGVCTCQSVPSFVRQVLGGVHHSLFAGVSVEVPLDSGVSAELSQTCTRPHEGGGVTWLRQSTGPHL